MKTAKQSSLAELFAEDEPRQVSETKPPASVWPFPTTLQRDTLKALPFNLDNFEDALI